MGGRTSRTTLMGHGVVRPSLKAKTHQFFFFLFGCHGMAELLFMGWFGHPKLVKKVAQIFNFYFFFYIVLHVNPQKLTHGRALKFRRKT
jgi:hypothetical protein